VRVDHNGRIESFTSFRSESGPVDEQGEWAGDELIFTLQVGEAVRVCDLCSGDAWSQSVLQSAHNAVKSVPLLVECPVRRRCLCRL
jgi:hypothetical protein